MLQRAGDALPEVGTLNLGVADEIEERAAVGQHEAGVPANIALAFFCR
jgi:hypothetical protein